MCLDARALVVYVCVLHLTAWLCVSMCVYAMYFFVWIVLVLMTRCDVFCAVLCICFTRCDVYVSCYV